MGALGAHRRIRADQSLQSQAERRTAESSSDLSSRIILAPLSAIISVGELVLPLVMVGMIEASMTRRPSMPRTRRRRRSRPPDRCRHPSGRADRMEDGGPDIARTVEEFLVRRQLSARPVFLGPVLPKRRHRDDVPDQAQRVHGNALVPSVDR